MKVIKLYDVRKRPSITYWYQYCDKCNGQITDKILSCEKNKYCAYAHKHNGAVYAGAVDDFYCPICKEKRTVKNKLTCIMRNGSLILKEKDGDEGCVKQGKAKKCKIEFSAKRGIK